MGTFSKHYTGATVHTHKKSVLVKMAFAQAPMDVRKMCSIYLLTCQLFVYITMFSVKAKKNLLLLQFKLFH